MILRKRIIGIITAIALMTGFIPALSYAASPERDPYEIIYANSLDGATKTGYNSSNAYLGSMSNGAGYYYENVNFGSTPPTYVEIGIGVPDEHAGATFQLVADSLDGDVIAEFDALSSGGFGISLVRRFEVKKRITGIHTIYLKKIKGSATNIYTIQFFAPLTGTDMYVPYSEESVFSDIGGSRYKKEINALTAFGIITPDLDAPQYYPDMYITRADFAQMVYNLLNVDWYNDADSRYTDMDKANEANKAVNYLADRGIMTVNGQTVDPDGFVTFAAAAEMLCRALGYEPEAQRYGTDTAYLKIAAEKGLTDGFSSNGKLRNEEAAKLIYNAATAEYFSYGTADDEGNFEYSNREIMITKTMGYKKAEGMIDETNNTSIAGPNSTVDYKHVRIGDESYNVGDTNAKSLFGYECEFFYSDDEGENKIIFIAPKSSVKVTEINSCDFDITKVTPELIEYSDNKRAKTIKPDKSTAVIYNGVAIDSPLRDLLDHLPLSGSVRYIENPHYSNVLFIDEYENIVIDAIDLDEEIITDKIADREIIFDTNSDFIYCNKDNENVRLKSIKPDDAAMLYISKNKAGGKVYRFVIGGGKFEGAVSRVDEDYIEIDGKNYKRAANLADDITAGANVEFYVNAANEVVKIKCFAAVDKIGLYVGSYLDSESDDKLYIKIYTTDNKQQNLPCSEKLFVDGIRAASYSEGKTLFDNCGADIEKTPVRYKVFKNTVTMVDTFKDGDLGIYDTLTRRRFGGNYQYDKTNRVLVNKSFGIVDGIFDSDGMFVSIWGDSSNINNYFFTGVEGSVSSLKGDLYSYDRDSNYINLFVITNRENDYDDPIVFHKLTTYIGADDEVWHKIIGFSSKGMIEYTINDDDIKSDGLELINYLKCGDWIRIKPKTGGEIAGLQIVYAPDGESGREYLDSKGEKCVSSYLINNNAYAYSTTNQDYRFVVGTVRNKFDDYIEISHDDGTSEFIAVINVSCVKLGDNGDEPTTGVTVSGIKKGDLVAVNIDHRQTIELVVLE